MECLNNYKVTNITSITKLKNELQGVDNHVVFNLSSFPIGQLRGIIRREAIATVSKKISENRLKHSTKRPKIITRSQVWLLIDNISLQIVNDIVDALFDDPQSIQFSILRFIYSEASKESQPMMRYIDVLHNHAYEDTASSYIEDHDLQDIKLSGIRVHVANTGLLSVIDGLMIWAKSNHIQVIKVNDILISDVSTSLAYMDIHFEYLREIYERMYIEEGALPSYTQYRLCCLHFLHTEKGPIDVSKITFQPLDAEEMLIHHIKDIMSKVLQTLSEYLMGVMDQILEWLQTAFSSAASHDDLRTENKQIEET